MKKYSNFKKIEVYYNEEIIEDREIYFTNTLSYKMSSDIRHLNDTSWTQNYDKSKILNSDLQLISIKLTLINTFENRFNKYKRWYHYVCCAGY